MDLSSILSNDKEGEPRRQSPESQRNGQAASQTVLQQQHAPPQYGRQDGGYQPNSRDGLAPLQVPVQNGQPVPYHPQTAQSPMSAQAHRPYESHPGMPTARSSYGPPQYPHQSPSQYHPGLPQAQTSSQSPTPSSIHTPQRQSPLSNMHPAPPHQHQQYPHYQSQPSTPLGPPPPFSRSTTQPHLESPYHMRSYSGTSNGPHSASPMYPPGQQPSPQQVRRTSTYLERERERSISVSPKTIPRPSIGSSRQSSQQELSGSNRSSSQTLQAAGGIASSPSGHATQQPYPPQPHFANPPPNPNLERTVSQGHPQTAIQQGVPNPSPLSTHQPPPPLLQQQSSQSSFHKMGMSNLVTPTSEVPPSVNGTSLPLVDSAQGEAVVMMTSKKRPASEAESQPPPKQQKTASPPPVQRRKYTHPPPWAQLSVHNQRHRGPPMANGARPQQPSSSKQASMPQPNGQPATANANGNANGVVLDGREPWLYNPPLDMDLIQARSVLGNWEKSMKWNTPYPDILRVVQDFLWGHLMQLGDVGTNPQEGTVEIEAKIGYLINSATDQRIQLPVRTMCVVHDDPNGYSFRSEMQLQDHRHINDYLNSVIKRTLTPGRVPMTYSHPVVTDSFHHLSPYAKQLIPPALQRYIKPKQDVRIRVSTEKNTNKVLARLVKLKVADLHIYNPPVQDCRISINVEVNLNRPDVDADALIAADDAQRGNSAARTKDRMSYKHLAYTIDLTKVDQDGMPSKFELEQEMDANILRQQMHLAAESKPNAFGDVVSGFLDNLVFLMREKAAS